MVALRDSDPYATWAAAYYCLMPKMDYLIRHLPTGLTLELAGKVDECGQRLAEACSYTGILDEPYTLIHPPPLPPAPSVQGSRHA